MPQDGLNAEPAYVDNAGQVLLWPYLQHYFASLGMLGNGRFSDIETACRGACMIEALVHDDPDYHDHRLLLNKVLCGLPPEQVVVQPGQMSEAERACCDDLLFAFTQQWAPLSNTPINGLRESFLSRDGRLQRISAGWSLVVSTDPNDLLLDQLPWRVSTIRLPWMSDEVHVEWR